MEDKIESELVDVSLLDGVYRRREFKAGDVVKTQVQQHALPEEVLSQLEKFLGDGTAKVTVGAELSHNREYCTAKSFVSVSSTCANTEDAIEAVHEIIHGLARVMVNEDLAIMKSDRDAHLAPGLYKAKTKEPLAAHMATAKIEPAVQIPLPRVSPPSFRR